MPVLYGWTATETHVTNPDGSVTVTRDSAWTDEEREAQYAFDELVCPRCGNLRSVCSDASRAWYPQRTMCYAEASVSVVRRRLVERYKKNEPGAAFHPLDGMSVWVAQEDLNPDDDFI